MRRKDFSDILEMVRLDDRIDECAHPLTCNPSFEKLDFADVKYSADAIFEAYQYSALSTRDIHKKRVREKLRSLYQLVDDHVSESRSVGSDKDGGFKNSVNLREIKQLRNEVKAMKLTLSSIEDFIKKMK